MNSCSSFSFFLVLLLIITITFAKLSEAACKGPGTYDHWIFFTTPLIAPNGSATDFASALPGTRWPYSGNFYDAPDATAAKALGYDTDLCTYLSADAPQMWQCTGTYIDSFGCSGYLTFSGFFNISAASGVFTVLGGTGDFVGAAGHITDVAKDEGWFLRTLVWKHKLIPLPLPWQQAQVQASRLL
eukprot:scaffold37057_cov146-Skeletonema_marinoi.AAC.3